jgi:5'-nucleotidase
VTGLLELPDLVVSGILGANMGDHDLFGCRPATEDSGIPSVRCRSRARPGATSHCGAHPGTSSGGSRAVEHPVLLNVNVPDVPFETLGGIEVTRLGKRHKAEGVVKVENPRGEMMYWIGAAGAAQDAGPGTDFHAVASNRVSITPLQMDLTHSHQITRIKEWVA